MRCCILAFAISCDVQILNITETRQVSPRFYYFMTKSIVNKILVLLITWCIRMQILIDIY